VILREDLVGDTALDKPLLFGISNGTGQDMILNLNGHDLDLSNSSAAIVLRGAESSTLRIMNGRLLNVAGSKISASNGNTIIFDSVDIVLAHDAELSELGVRIEGHSSVYGVRESVLTVVPHESATFTIASDATFTVCDGITYTHESSSSSDFVFESSTAQLALIGAIFKRSDSDATDVLMLKRGHLFIDHKSYMHAGSHGIAFGDGELSTENLKIDFRPGATLTVLHGSVLYNNVE